MPVVTDIGGGFVMDDYRMVKWVGEVAERFTLASPSRPSHTVEPS